MQIMAKSQIRILEKQPDGRFVQVDEVRRATRQVEASLFELATGGVVDPALTLSAKTKKGRSYTAKLARPAAVRFNPATGQLDADILLHVSLDGKFAQVVSKSTTESRRSPKGDLRGQRASGLLGKGPMTVNLVAANSFEPAGEPERPLLVREEYRLAPLGRTGRDAPGRKGLDPTGRGAKEPRSTPPRTR